MKTLSDGFNINDFNDFIISLCSLLVVNADLKIFIVFKLSDCNFKMGYNGWVCWQLSFHFSFLIIHLFLT